MFCKDCGAQLGSNARFCPNCGSAQAVTPPTEPVHFADKVRATAKKVGSSPLFLAAIICFTLMQVLDLFSLVSAGNVFETYNETFAEFGADTLDLSAPLLVLGIIGMIPGILIAIGLWITYSTCASRKNCVNTTGLTMIFVVNLVQLVVSSLILLGVLLLTIIALPESNHYNYSFIEASVLKPVLTALLITVLIFFAFVLLYYIKVCTTISNVRSTLKTSVPNKRASRFVAIMCYIGGGVLILSGIGDLLGAGITTLDGFYDDSLSYVLPSDLFLSAISCLLSAATHILFGILIFSYRSKMKALETEARIHSFKTLSYAEPYTAPVYIPPEPAAKPEVIAEPAAEEETE